MTCRVCHYEWCWLCGATYSSIHFSELNPLGCPGMQTRSMLHQTKARIYLRRALLILGFLILLPIVLPLLLVLSGPAFLMLTITKSFECCDNCWGQVLLSIVCFPFGVVFGPIIWIGAAVYFMP
jgi:hypothetical protein